MTNIFKTNQLRASTASKDYLNQHIENTAILILKKANTYAQHANRITIKESDINLAIQDQE